jgi:hypothetical protein
MPIDTAKIDHLSWSSKSCYSVCPRRYAFRYLEKVPEEFVPASLKFGSAFHVAAERLQQRRLEGTFASDMDEALAVFDRQWAQEISGAQVRYGKDESATSLRELAVRMLAAYCQHVVDSNGDGAQIIAIEHSSRFNLLAEVPPIEARLDLLELQGTALVVTDLKTSRSRWSDAKTAAAIPQLVLYATSLLPLMRELGATRIVTKFVVVTKAKSPIVQVLQPKASQDDVVRLKQTISESWAAIQTGVFPRRESWVCGQCPFHNRCLGRPL